MLGFEVEIENAVRQMTGEQCGCDCESENDDDETDDESDGVIDGVIDDENDDVMGGAHECDGIDDVNDLEQCDGEYGRDDVMGDYGNAHEKIYENDEYVSDGGHDEVQYYQQMKRNTNARMMQVVRNQSQI